MTPSSLPDIDHSRRRRLMVVAALAGVILLIIATGSGVVRPAVAFIRSAAAGADGPGARAAIYGLASTFTFLTVLLPLPAEASAFLNGSLFPAPVAFGLTWTMAMAGAGASYEIGRRHGRAPAHRIFGTAPMDRVERLIDRAGWPTLLALRLSPIMAFTAINWASGILALSRPVFYWTTAAGLVPGTYVFTVIPDLLDSGASTARLIGLAIAAALGLLGVSYLRVRKMNRTERHMDGLILVDLQNDFMPGGALAVADGDAAVPVANALAGKFETVVATRDWHPASHGSFVTAHPDKAVGDLTTLGGLEQVVWPVHCVQDQEGSAFHPALDMTQVDEVVSKGTDADIDSYSAFFDNGHRRATGLEQYLRNRGVARIYILGLATDYCVKYTALDAQQLGFETWVVEDGCRGVELNVGDSDTAIQEMRDAGVGVVRSEELLQS